MEIAPAVIESFTAEISKIAALSPGILGSSVGSAALRGAGAGGIIGAAGGAVAGSSDTPLAKRMIGGGLVGAGLGAGGASAFKRHSMLSSAGQPITARSFFGMQPSKVPTGGVNPATAINYDPAEVSKLKQFASTSLPSGGFADKAQFKKFWMQKMKETHPDVIGDAGGQAAQWSALQTALKSGVSPQQLGLGNWKYASAIWRYVGRRLNARTR